MIYNFTVDLTDHEATIRACPVNNDVAKRMIEVPADQFRHQNQDYKTHRKWKYMLEMCKVYFKMSTRSDGKVARVRIISLDLADLREAVKHMASGYS